MRVPKWPIITGTTLVQHPCRSIIAITQTPYRWFWSRFCCITCAYSRHCTGYNCRFANAVVGAVSFSWWTADENRSINDNPGGGEWARRQSVERKPPNVLCHNHPRALAPVGFTTVDDAGQAVRLTQLLDPNTSPACSCRRVQCDHLNDLWQRREPVGVQHRRTEHNIVVHDCVPPMPLSCHL